MNSTEPPTPETDLLIKEYNAAVENGDNFKLFALKKKILEKQEYAPLQLRNLLNRPIKKHRRIYS